jgi:hypothetical protein
MNAVDKIEELFEQSPQDPDLQILKQFCLSLEAGKPFDLRLLASLTFESFNLGMDVLRQWRADASRSIKRSI